MTGPEERRTDSQAIAELVYAAQVDIMYVARRAATEFFSASGITPSAEQITATDDALERLHDEHLRKILADEDLHSMIGHALALTALLTNARALGIEAAKVTVDAEGRMTETPTVHPFGDPLIDQIRSAAAYAATEYFTLNGITPNAERMKSTTQTLKSLFSKHFAKMLEDAQRHLPSNPELAKASFLNNARLLGIEAAKMAGRGRWRLWR